MVFLKEAIVRFVRGLRILRQDGIAPFFQAVRAKFHEEPLPVNAPLSVEDWLSYYERRAELGPQKNKLPGNAHFPKVSILILTFNNLTINQLCLRSVYCNTTYPNFEVIVVDNASTDETPFWLKTYAKTHSNLRLILNANNLGFAGGNNQAAHEADGEYLVFLNNDTIVTKGWVERLLAHFLKDPTVGLVGPVTNATGNEALIPVSYATPEEMEAFAANNAATMSGKSFDIRMLAFYCVMARKTQYESLGGLDERYAVGMFEDDDMAVRYHQRGLRVVCAEDVFIHHFQGASFGKLQSEKYQAIFEENRKKYEEKWGRKWETYRVRQLFQEDLKSITKSLVINWGPRLTEQGHPFNIQTNGKSGIWIDIRGLSCTPDTRVFFGEKLAEDVCPHPEGVNAAIPTSYLNDVGSVDIVIKDSHWDSAIFVGVFNIVPSVKVTQQSIALPLVDLITSYHTTINFLSDMKRFSATVGQDQRRLIENGVADLEHLLVDVIPGLNYLLLSSSALKQLAETVDCDRAVSWEWAEFCTQVERLKVITVRIARAIRAHSVVNLTAEDPNDNQEIRLAEQDLSFETLKRHNQELMYLEALAGTTAPLSTPSHLLFDVSNRCNFRCRTCYQSVRQNFAYNDLPNAAVNNLQAFLPSCMSANIAGAGEPLLSPSTPRLIQMLGSYGVFTDLVTNGSLLSRVRGISHNLDHILISMDGASSETVDTIRFKAQFNKIIADIKNLPIDIRRKIIINMVVCRANVHEIHKLVRLAKKIGVAGVGLQEFSAYLPWHASMKLLAEDQPLLMQQIRASRKELSGQDITSLLVACATYGDSDRKIIKPDYRRILKSLNGVQTPVEPSGPHSWIELVLEFQTAAALKIPKVLFHALAPICIQPRFEDIVSRDVDSQSVTFCARKDGLLSQLRMQPVIRFPHCLAPYSLMNIHSDGAVKPCCVLDRHCGSLTADSAWGVWHSPAYVKLRQSFATGVDLPELCIGCKDGVRFAQSDKLLVYARDIGIDVSRIVMPVDGCAPAQIDEVIINPDFTSTKGWHLSNPSYYDSDLGIMSATSDAPTTQFVAVSARRHYSYSIVARSTIPKNRGRMQVSWLNDGNVCINTVVKVFKCAPTWTRQTMEIIAPNNAAGAIVFLHGHSKKPVEFKSCSLKETMP